MGFNIRFIEKRSTEGCGEIVLDDFIERFESPFNFWKAADYERQWVEGVTRILQGELTSVLVTLMVQPEIANFIMWWPMYRDGNMVVFHNHLLMMKRLKQPFEITNLYSFIPHRFDSVDEEYIISEWTIEIDKLKSFSLESNSRWG
jgi:hypothetical protein